MIKAIKVDIKIIIKAIKVGIHMVTMHACMVIKVISMKVIRLVSTRLSWLLRLSIYNCALIKNTVIQNMLYKKQAFNKAH